MKTKNAHFYIAILLPILTGFIFEIGYSHIYVERFYNFLENILFAFILSIPISGIASQKFRFLYAKFVFLGIVFMVSFETGYYLIFNSKFNASSVFVFMQTNTQEAKEFLDFYIDARVMFLLTVLMGITVFFFFSFKRFFNPTTIIKTKRNRIFLFLGLSVGLMLVSYTRRENLPFIVAKAVYDLKRDSFYDNDNYFQDRLGPFSATATENSKKIITIVIGESTSRRHMQLYGYYRKTTPRLSAMKDDLVVYNDVISPNALTVETLKKALTIDVDDKKGSIVQLLNSRGFKTYWISNQNPIGVFESFVSKVAKACDKQEYLTTSTYMDNKIFDEKILSYLENVMADEGDKKVVFIHLQGTHFNYKYRFPKAFEHFNTEPKSVFSGKEVNSTINNYDNAVLYNDYVVSSFIEALKKQELNSALLYFSDHGEEVYDTMDFVGHTDDVGSLPMFEIPFVLWQSQTFKNLNHDSFVRNSDRPYQTNALYHSIAHLCQVTDTSVNLEKSIFSETFKKARRNILNGKNYDSLVQKANIKL
ncbi:sulfatase-like hydrolase/transferase [Pseudotamlana agarivorans]|uniref:sulfatase-like hydrolase/transferase n=1 Tax=Pseudotamlana agarivorans TaxID=481183 RepID=UPI00083648B8|nr:sulfatase-like hydrolase/transferase [Tamlana agarivorans]